MGERYSRILESARYYSAIDNYIRYIQGQKDRSVGIGTRGPRPASRRLFIKPFGKDLPEGQFAISSGNASTWHNRQADFNQYSTDNAPADTANAIRLEDFRAARVNIRTNISTTIQKKVSRVTGLAYGYRGGQSTSLPFGKNVDTDDEAGVFLIIKNRIEGANPPANQRITHIREKV